MAGYHQQVFKHDTGTDYLVFSLALPTQFGVRKSLKKL